jgi:hypothetical protein
MDKENRWDNSAFSRYNPPVLQLQSRPKNYPFKPLVMTPLRIFFCAMKNTITIGRI